MKTVGLRSIVLYILLLAFLGGVGYLGVNLFLHGSEWAMQPYNGHLYAADENVSMGTITDRGGNVLAYTDENGVRLYGYGETNRRALLHTVGDPWGYISTGVQNLMGAKLAGYNIVTGLNDTPLTHFNRDVELTVDQPACAAAFTALGGRNGAVLVYNYKTGEILVKVSAPGFDPEHLPEDLNTNEAYNGVFLDNTLSGSFTPGSIFKLVTAAAAMDLWPDSWSERTYTCSGSENIGGGDITCLHGNAHGTQDIFDAMGNSCNVYFARLANDIGADALERKARELGFGQSFSFGSAEVKESTIDLKTANANQLGWAGVGQYTVLVNPYHMLLLAGAAAGGGKAVTPRLTEDLNLFGEIADGEQLMSTSTASQLKALMRYDVERYYGDWLFPAGLNVCAKTGTGEVGENKKPNCWMIGFCDNEQYPYAFAVLVIEGEGGIESAGGVAAAALNALVK